MNLDLIIFESRKSYCLKKEFASNIVTTKIVMVRKFFFQCFNGSIFFEVKIYSEKFKFYFSNCHHVKF